MIDDDFIPNEHELIEFQQVPKKYCLHIYFEQPMPIDHSSDTEVVETICKQLLDDTNTWEWDIEEVDD